MFPIAPLDYERNTVVNSPLLIQEVGQGEVGAQNRNAEPIGPSNAQLNRRDSSSQNIGKQAGEDVNQSRTAGPHLDGRRSISSPLSVELSSIVGISPEFLTSAQGSSEVSPQEVSDHYESSDEKPAPKLNIPA